MNIEQAKEQVAHTVRAYMERDETGMHLISPVNQRPIFLMGAPGIGKTAIIDQIAQEMGLGVISYSMTHHTRQSVLGLPFISHRNYKGHEYVYSEYTMSEIIGAVYDYMEQTGQERGILFLDEINCVSETLYPSMLQFLQYKRFGRHTVPEDWVIVCAGNPPEYNRSVHEFDVVTLDRLRQIRVEPDYAVWKRYAAGRGLHPVVTTFLEAKPDCFYRVEKQAGGQRSFVTARGWDDLAQVISVYEKTGEPCDGELFAQFLHDDTISQKFALYYELFKKYRSDYQIAKILDGTAGADVVNRAREAALDERIAVIGLVLDALGAACQDALELGDVCLAMRDALRTAKPLFIEGATVDEALVEPIVQREAELNRKVAGNMIGARRQRVERLTIQGLRAVATACGLAKADRGEAAFEASNSVYREKSQQLKPLATEASRKIDNAFAFIEQSFGDGREMVMFTAELSTREATTQFISRFGNDAYYAHNGQLQVDQTRAKLIEEIEQINADEDLIKNGEIGEYNSLDLGSGAGMRKL